MADERTESITIDHLEPPDRYFRQDVSALIAHGKARTANLVAVVLVTGVVLSLPLYLLVVWCGPTYVQHSGVVFDKWYSIMSPLAGTAIGAYYGARIGEARRGAE